MYPFNDDIFIIENETEFANAGFELPSEGDGCVTGKTIDNKNWFSNMHFEGYENVKTLVNLVESGFLIRLTAENWRDSDRNPAINEPI